MNAITVGKALATISVGWAALFSMAHTDINIPVTETTTEPKLVTETETIQFSDISDKEWLNMRDYEGRYYPATGIITEINEDQDTYIWEDFNGNVWVEIGIEDLSEGDRIALIMNNNGTSEIYDDFAVNIRYVGWVY